MSSPLRPIGNPAAFDITFWLLPAGTDNGVWASAWAELADLDPVDIGPVLRALATAGVGGYVATPGGHARHRRQDATHRLWVDSLQYHKAEDVLMAYFCRRDRHDD
jgi:hypothetical protein